MENLLIVLVFVASIVYKIYSNYKEEMEKSAKRSPQRRPHQQNIEGIPPVKTGTGAQTAPVIPQLISKEPSNPFVTKSNIVQEIPDEVQRARQNRKVNPMERTEDRQLEKQLISFDLRQAVIQAAILERPYK